MTTVAVVAHSGKVLGGGLGELREVLSRAGVTDPLWYEIPKSRMAPKAVRRAIKAGADLLLVWGGDGTVQRCVDAVAGLGLPIAILPAGTANLFATNLDIPLSVQEAVDVALHGDDRAIDLGVLNGEHFGVMAGAGFDALMIRDADGGLKDRFGRAAYLWTGLKNVSASEVSGRVKVDGSTFFKGKLSCVLVGNVPKVFGSLEAFEGARPDDGLLDIGVVSASTPTQWARTVGRVVLDRAERSPFVEVTRGHDIRVKLDRPMPYELDGGERGKTKKLRFGIRPAAIVVRVPSSRGEQSAEAASS